MKIHPFLLGLFFIAFTACSDDDGKSRDENLPISELPSAIQTYLTQHFPSQKVHRAVKDTENNKVSYEVYLDPDTELEFDANHQVTDIHGVGKLPDSVIPDTILAYVIENYPENFISDWELERDHQQVTLNNTIELEFTLDGEFIRIDK